MNNTQRKILEDSGVNVSGLMHRLCDNERVLDICLKGFLSDDNMAKLNDAVGKKDFKSAFQAAHALKGVAGNMSFDAFMPEICEIVDLLRADNTADIDAHIITLNGYYSTIVQAIGRYYAAAD